MWETWVQSVGWEDPLAEDMATHSSILAWRILMDSGAWRAAVAAPFYTQQTEYASSSSSTSHHPLAFFSANSNGLEWVNLTQMIIISTNAVRNPSEEME